MDISTTDTAPDDREDRLRMVTDSAEAVLRDDLDRARGLRFGVPGFDPEKLMEFAGLGWTMLRVSEADGGLGMGLAELCAVARQLGRRLTPEPVLALAVVAPVLPEALRDDVMAGAAVVLPAFAPYGGAAPVLAGGRLTGTAEPVPLGLGAAAFVVQTTTGAALVAADAPGVTITRQDSHDGGHLAALSFDGAEAEPITCDAEALRDEAALALAAYLLGLAEEAFDITSQYLKDRKQFGQPIGAFQALQHRMVDLYLERALLDAAVEAAAETCDAAGATPDARARAVSLARARAARAAHQITQAAIQLHGGIGYTDEANIGLYLRKTMTLAGLLGTERFHRDRAYALREAAE